MQAGHDFDLKYVCSQVTSKGLSKTIGKSTVAFSGNMEMFNGAKSIFLFYAIKLHKLCRKQTLIGSKYLSLYSPYLNSIFSFFLRLIFTKSGQNQVICITCVRQFLWRSHRDVNKQMPMLHILISGHHSNNRITESDKKLNEIKSTW